MKKLNTKGFGAVEALLIIVIVGIIGGAGYMVYNSQKKTNESLDNASSSLKSASQANSEKSEKKEDKSDPNEGYLVIKEWGLRFKTPTELTDIKYVVNGETVAFYAKPKNTDIQYRSNYETFAENNARYAVGTLYRSSESTKDVLGEPREGKKIGNYYYYTGWAFSSLATGRGCVGLFGDSEKDCETEQKVFQLVNQSDTGLLNTIEEAQQ